MLKIKDNVDLKVLEKYGFNKELDKGIYIKRNPRCYEYLEINQNNKIRIYVEDEYYEMYTREETLEDLYDLIQDGLVEKVDD